MSETMETKNLLPFFPISPQEWKSPDKKAIEEVSSSIGVFKISIFDCLEKLNFSLLCF